MSQGDKDDNMYVAAGAAFIASPFLFALMSCSGRSSGWPAVKVRDPWTSAEKPLANAWVYWKKDSAITVLRADKDGVLYALDSGKTDKTAPWDYNTSFRPKLGQDVELYFSRGARPVPDGELAANPAAFRRIKSAKAMTLDDFALALAKPRELSVWPLFWELPVDKSELHHQNFAPAGSPDYLTAGLLQKAAAWNGNTPAVTENAAAPAAPDSVTVGAGANATTVRIRPRERGLAVEGRIDKGATGVRIKVYSASQSLVRLRAGIDPAAQRADWVAAAQMGAVSASADTREFKATVFFENAADAFGPVQVFVVSEGLAPPVMDSFLVYLTGVQAALVDDYSANANGSQRGPVLRETDEVNIVDFVVSPQATSNALRNQTRLRRMTRYQFANAQRPLNSALPQGANNPLVIKPQMPLWMAELHLVGMNDKKLGEFMSYRYFKEKVDFGTGKDPPYPATLKLDLSWRMKLYWDGPDENSANFNVSNNQIHYSYSHELAASQKVRLFFRDGGKLTDSKKKDVALEAGGAAPGAFREQPALPQFPVAGRRQPKVVLSGQARHWGRHAAAAPKDAVVIEFQLRIVDNGGVELVAGGNGSLECSVTSIDLLPVDAGLVPDSTGTLAVPPAADPHARLPTFRVAGRNLATAQERDGLVQALVDEYYDAHRTVNSVAMLSQACWRTTAQRIFQHEAGLNQFDSRATHRSVNDANNCYYGNEHDMPIFGWPHGYGMGQIDNFVDNGATRGANTGEVWSFVENLRTAVRIIMEVKAQAAYAYLTGLHALNSGVQRDRAVYQREIVRRYNGGREFRWNGSDWEISPSQFLQGTARLAYPNQVLGTNVAYSVTQPNGTVTYPWPVAFAQADYGPDT